jgi:DNA-binding transcriptional LysR family regulator
MRSSGGLYVWEFEKNGKEVNVRVEGQITFNGAAPIMEAVRSGHGIAYVMEDRAKPLIESGAAIRIMESWCPWFDGYHLYYPSRRQPTPAFSLLVEALRHRET